MICHGLDCPGFAEAHPHENGGLRLQRVPEAVRTELNERAQQRVLHAAANELRCVTDDGSLTLTLSAPGGGIHGVVFHGGFQSGQQFGVGETPREIRIEPPRRFHMMEKGAFAEHLYATRVTRMILAGGEVVLHGAEGPGLRVPTGDELPARKLLTYGTSITHGAAASLPHLCYARQLAWRLQADLVNLGVGGSCHCEKAFADYIAGREGWNIALLSLSVNMIGAGFSLEDFRARVKYLLDVVAGNNPRRPVACMTILPYFRDLPKVNDPAPQQPPVEGYRRQLREAAAACARANLHVFEGPEMLDRVDGLSDDLLHPGDLGMIRIGENLAKKIAPLLA